MASSSINVIKGLQTFPNYIDGDAGTNQNIASNVVIDRDNILEPRRGMKVLTELPDFSKQLLKYKDRIFCHYGNSLGYLNTSDSTYMTTMKNTANFSLDSSSYNISIIDHSMSIGDSIFFTKTRDYSTPGAYFTMPTGIDEVSSYVIYQVIDKDTFTIATSTSSSPILLGGPSKATLIYDFIVNEVSSKLRIKYIELNSNLYLTTDSGVKKISQLNPYSMSYAGGITALNMDLSLSFVGTGGFFGPLDSFNKNVEVAYRVLWGTKDVNTNLILGKPSERAFIQNYTQSNADILINFPVPQGINTNYFYQIYRTIVSVIEGSGDEMRLIYEAPYDGYSTLISITDSTPDVIRNTGVPLYNNELSGEGSLQTNNRPPVCEDICVYKDRAWYANTKTSQKLDMTFLGFDGFRDPIDAPAAAGNPAVINLPTGHGVVAGDYVALANTISVDGQYLVTNVTPSSITINVDSSLFGLNYVLYRSYVTITKNTQKNRYFFVGKPETTNIVAKQYGLSEQTKLSIIATGTYYANTVVGPAKYFKLNTPSISHYFYFVVDAIKDLDPALAGSTGHAVNILSTDTSIDIASKLYTAISLLSLVFTATILSDAVTVTNVESGTSVDATTSTPPAGTILVKTQGSYGVVSSEYFNLTSIDDKIKYSFWFAKKDTDIAPIISGRILVKVDLYTTSTITDNDVRDRIRDAINNTSDFLAIPTLNPGEVIISTITSGAVTDIISATQTNVTTNLQMTSLVSINKVQDGFGENISLGFARLSSYASPAAAIEDTAKSLVKVINFNNNSPVYSYYIATSTSLPGQFYLEEKNFSSSHFSILGTGFKSSVSFNPVINTEVKSTNNIGNNVLMFSKKQQPEAVPTTNLFRIGPQDKAIKRILGLRDSLFIFKEEGVYRLTGDSETNFSVAFFDNSGIILAPDSAVILNNQIYFLGIQGVSTAAESGIGVISRPIENIFNRATSDNFKNYSTASFGISYEADRSYIIFIANNESDVNATIAYRYNSFTRTWTSFDKSAICGVVSLQNKLHIGAVDIPAIEIERKSLTSRDYVDRSFNREISAYSSGKVYVDSVSNIEIGDSLTQTQYLNINDYNDLVGKLKIDPTLNFSPLFSSLSLTGGLDFSNGLYNLVTELNTKDTSRFLEQFTSSTSNKITKSTPLGIKESDIVLYTSLDPKNLINNTYYRVVNSTDLDFQLTNLKPNVFAKTNLTLGIGVLTSTIKILDFNLVRDIDYITSEIVFPDHGLIDGDLVTYTNNSTPVVAVPPTGIVNNRQYKVINATTSRFQLIEVYLDLDIAENGSLQVSYYYSGESVSNKMQREFNDIIDALNKSTSAFFTNYDYSVGSNDLDIIVSEINISQNYIKTDIPLPFYLGAVVHYQSIKSEIVWEYSTFGAPSSLKHVSEGTIMIEQNSLNKLTVGYASDISGNFENVEFKLDGDGNFGKAIFGETAFGGNGTSYPLRTLIPRMKQRCRHIKCRIFHNSAWMKFNILGVSYKFEITSERAYRR